MDLYIMDYVLIFICLAVSIVGGFFLYEYFQKQKAITKLDEYLNEYRVRIAPENRILCNRTLIAKAFPEYNSKVHRYMWEQCVDRGWVTIDDRDREWIVAP